MIDLDKTCLETIILSLMDNNGPSKLTNHQKKVILNIPKKGLIQ